MGLEFNAAARLPSVWVRANGVLLSGIVAAETLATCRGVGHFKVTQAIGSQAQFDKTIWMQPGLISISISIGLISEATKVNVMDGIVDSVSYIVGQGIVEVQGRDRAASLLRMQSPGALVNRTADEIVAEIAGRNGLSYTIPPAVGCLGWYDGSDYIFMQLPEWSRVASDWDVLQLIADQCGWDFYTTCGQIVLKDQTSTLAMVRQISESSLLSLRLSLVPLLALPFQTSVSGWNSWQCSQTFGVTEPVASDGNAIESLTVDLGSEADILDLSAGDSGAERIARRRAAQLKAGQSFVEIECLGELTLQPCDRFGIQGERLVPGALYKVDRIERHISAMSGFIEHVLAYVVQ
jgi:hypothetical protein